MGWAEGSIKKYAEKGMLSAEMVKNAQLAAMDEIDRKFNSMPMTWAQVWTSAMNMIQKGSAPFLTVVGWLANNMSIIGAAALGIRWRRLRYTQHLPMELRQPSGC